MQALWYIATKLLSAVTCHYFDDFPTVERSQGCKVLSLAFSAILDMLGWQHAKEGGKALNFSEAFDLLGVTFDLTQVPKGILKITNKVSRISKLCGMLDSIASAGELSSSRASELQGLLNFAVGFVSGKSLKHLVAAFMPHADKPAKMVSEQLGHLCSYAKTMLQSLGPRVHTALGEKRPVLFFTDAAWEDKKATAGAVVIDGTFRACAAVVVPDALVEHWTRHAGEQIISQVEMWALLAARWHYRFRFAGRRIFAWIDNEAARICAIKASSSSQTMRAMARLLSDLEILFPVFTWVERVCSFSNPSDLPSRGKFQEAMSRFNLSDDGPIDATGDLCEMVLQLHRQPFASALLSLGSKTLSKSNDMSPG